MYKPMLECLESRNLLSTIKWMPGGTNNWSDSGNWFPHQVPAAGDIAQFVGGPLCNLPCTVDNSTTIGQLYVADDYTSTITISYSLKIDGTGVSGSSGQDNGTITGGTLEIYSTTFDWRGGTLAGDGYASLLQIDPAAIFNIHTDDATDRVFDGRNIFNEGQINWIGDGSGALRLKNAVIIDNYGTDSSDRALFLIAVHNNNHMTDDTNNDIFFNSGVFQKDYLGGTDTTYIDALFTNQANGVMEDTTGMMAFSELLTSAGQINLRGLGLLANSGFSTSGQTDVWVSAASLVVHLDTTNDHGKIVLDAAGTLTMTGSYTSTGGTLLASVNGPTITVSHDYVDDGGWDTLYRSLTVGGEMDVNNGTLFFVSGTTITTASGLTLENDGILTGSGTIGGTLYNKGVVDPGGTGLGGITVTGNYQQTSAGVLYIDLFSSGSYDHLIINGQASLAGTCWVIQVGTWNAAGYYFQPIHWGSLVGVFDTVNLPPGHWSYGYSGGYFTLHDSFF